MPYMTYVPQHVADVTHFVVISTTYLPHPESTGTTGTITPATSELIAPTPLYTLDCHALSKDNGGGSGIRTHGSRSPKAFQELRIRPLCHPSS